jgi:hypothetical protein
MRTVVKAIAATAFAALLGIATQASAVLITVAEEGGWTGSDNANDSFTGTPADNHPGLAAPAGTSTTAGWFANSDPKSGLILDFFGLTLDVPADGTPVNFLIARISQINEVIFPRDADPPIGTGPYIHTLDFAAEFRILNADAGDAVLFSDDPTGSVRHTETRNIASLCLTQDASENAAGSICDDIYGFTLNLAPPIPFVIDGVTYGFGFAIAPGPGTVFGTDGRVYTPENSDNFIDVVVTIRALVPEPGTLALFAVALIGLAFVGRRKRS